MPSGEPRNETRPSEQLVIRALRHEIGDFLQSVYAMTAILQNRLPDDAEMERQLVSELRGRAELVRHMIDGLYVLLAPESLQCEALDLAALVRQATGYVGRYIHPRCVTEAPAAVHVVADARILHEVIALLCLAASRTAREELVIRAAANGNEAELQLVSDGPGPTLEQRQWLERLLPTTHDLPIGLALAYAKHAAERHGGRFTLTDLPAGNVLYRLVLPLATPDG